MGKSNKNPTHIKDLVPDEKNARRHTARNIGTIEESLHAVGAGRSIVIDEANKILAGNGLIEAAANAGITKLQVVEADGNTVIAVRRTGLTKKQKVMLALADNRTSTLAEWDTDNLADLLKDLDAEDLQKLALTDADLKAMDLLNDESAPAASMEIHGQFLVMITCADEAAQSEVLAKCLKENWSCKALSS